MTMAGQHTDEMLRSAAEHYRTGDIGETERLCHQFLKRDSRSVHALHLMGLACLASANYSSARDFLQQAASAAPGDHLCNYNLGEACRHMGLFREAAESYEKAIVSTPSFVEARNNLGIVLAEMGLLDDAIRNYEQNLLIAPDSVNTLMNLGNLFIKTGRFSEAATCLKRVIFLDADFVEAYDGFCRAQAAMERSEEELACLINVLATRPDASHMLDNLGKALQGLCRFDEALDVYDRSLLIYHCPAQIYYSRGLLLQNMGCLGEAYHSLATAIRLEASHAEWHDELGLLCYTQGLFDEAKLHFQAAVDARDDFATGHFHLGAILSREGLIDAAANEYGKAYALDPRPGYKVLLATLLPVVPFSIEEIESSRSSLLQKVDDLSGQALSVDDPFRDIGRANFYLAYHGLNDRDIQTKLARFYESICPSLAFVAPHCNGKSEDKVTGRIRIGFISRHFRNHTVGQYMRGIIANLDRDAFEVHVFMLPHKKDEITEFIEKQAESVKWLPENLFMARRIIAERKLDILFYSDIGMDPFTYFLAFSRLAPAQCAFYGHPVTTGIKTIDYFISHTDCEPPGAEAQYSERLIRLSQGVSYTYYYRPQAQMSTKQRLDFSLSDSAHIYLCAQSLFKVHPDLDLLIKGILSKDEDAIVVFFEGEHANWTDILVRRLRGSSGR